MNIVVIDGQGGRIGCMLVDAIKRALPQAALTAIGTNALATSAMLKAGASHAATGENPVIVACQQADIIAGPIGIVLADALLGEVTANMAAAVGRSRAEKVLVPLTSCGAFIAGLAPLSLGEYVELAIRQIVQLAENKPRS